MKKYIFVIVLPLLIPITTYAVWYNPTTWFSSNDRSSDQLLQRVSDLEKKLSDKAGDINTTVTTSTNKTGITKDNSNGTDSDQVISLKEKISSLQNQLSVLQSKYSICSSNTKKTTVSSNTDTSTVVSTNQDIVQLNKPYDYDNYTKINIKDYVKSPSKWIGWGVNVIAVSVVDFIGANNIGEPNYLLVSDATSDSYIPEKMIIEIDKQKDYDSVIYRLKKGDVITVYGIGLPNQNFKIGLSNLDSTFYSVVKVQRIDTCSTYGNCSRGNTAYLLDTAI